MSNFFSKLASTVSVVTLVAASTSASFVAAASEFTPYAEALADNGVITAQSTEAAYRLGDTITRAELAKVVANLGGYTPADELGNIYSDVTSSLGDLAGYIEALAEAGVVSTSSATFRPTANVTRAEAVKLILGALGEEGSETSAGYTDVTASLGDLAGFINRANELGVIGDATYFRPNASITRGEAFKVAAAAAQLEVGTTDDNGTVVPPVTTSTGTVVAGALSVALDGTAAAQYVPKNASNVKVGSVKLTAATADVSVNSFTILRSGLGDSSNLTLAIAQSGMVISENRSVNTATQEGIVRLNNTLVVKAGTTVTVDVLASVAGSANSQHQFSLKAVGTSATVTGAPVTLGLVNTTDYEVSKVKVLADAVNMNEGVTSGKNDQALGTVKLQAGAKDITLSAFTLSKTSGIDLTRVLANVKVFKNGTQVGTASVTTDKIYVTGLSTKVARNDTVTFELRGDVIHVGSAETLNISIAETTDVTATEDLTGYSTQTDLATANVADTVFSVTDLDIVWTKNTTKSVTVAPGASSVVLFDAKLAASATFDVTQFTVKGQSANAAALDDTDEETEFTSLTLTVNGVDYDLLNTDQTTGKYVFSKTSDKFRVDADTSVNVKLVANLSNSASPATYTYNVAIDTVKNISNGNTVTSLNKNITGDQVSVESPTLTIKASTVAAPSSSKIYSNASALEIGRFGLEAKAEEITVREITLTNVATNGTNDFTKLVSGTNVKLVNVADNTQVSATVTVNAGNIKLTGMSIKVAKDTTSNFKVVVDTQGDLPSTFVTAATEVSTYTVAGTATANGTMVVTVNGTAYNVAVTNGDDAATVAAAIDTAIGATATTAGSVVTVTAAAAGAQTDAAVASVPAGLTVTPAVTTQGVAAVNGGANLTLRVALDSASSSSKSSITATAYSTTKPYAVSVIPPTVTLTKKSANVFLVKITNADADSDITLSSITAQVRPVSVANSSYEAYACIREEGSSEKCGLAAVANKVQKVPGSGVTFTTTVDSPVSLPVTISKNSSITREIFVDSAFVNPSDLQAEITALNYGVSETYSVVAQ